MERAGHDNANFFVGTEVEHSPAFGLRTLFVVGLQDPFTVIAMAQKNNVGHIYFGANMSFPNPAVNDATQWNAWEKMIQACLGSGAWCTLDLDVSAVEGLAESMLCENNRFIPMISVKLPYIGLLNYNAVIKLDDKDFEATNPGVWCHSVHDLKNREVFTDWSKYTQDKVLS
jgi:hypothetical protein